MKILIVTSEVTFVPHNYNQFLEGVLEGLSNESDIQLEVALLKNNDLSFIGKGLFLTFIGARHFGFHLLKNSLSAFFNDKKQLEKSFKKDFLRFTGPNSPEFIDYVTKNNIDLIVNARTRFIYKSRILKAPKLGALNIHHGILPNNRGTMCDLWALHDGLETGFSVHKMDKKIDNGDIIRVIKTSSLGDDIRSNYLKLVAHSAQLEAQTICSVIKEINKDQKIPIEILNKADSPTYTKNPNLKSIRAIKNKGISL